MTEDVQSREHDRNISKLWCNFWKVVGPIVLVMGLCISVIALIKVYQNDEFLVHHHNHEDYEQWVEEIIIVDNQTTSDMEY